MIKSLNCVTCNVYLDEDHLWLMVVDYSWLMVMAHFWLMVMAHFWLMVVDCLWLMIRINNRGTHSHNQEMTKCLRKCQTSTKEWRDPVAGSMLCFHERDLHVVKHRFYLDGKVRSSCRVNILFSCSNATWYKTSVLSP